MLILELKPGELLRMRTPSGEVIDVILEDSSQHRARFSISAPATIHIDTEENRERHRNRETRRAGKKFKQ